MKRNFEKVYGAVRDWAKSHGIQVSLKRLPAKKAGEFDGLSVSMNSELRAERRRTYYLVPRPRQHRPLESQPLRTSRPCLTSYAMPRRKATLTPAARAGNRRPIAPSRPNPSEFAVWLLTELGHADVVPSYTNFMQARPGNA